MHLINAIVLLTFASALAVATTCIVSDLRRSAPAIRAAFEELGL